MAHPQILTISLKMPMSTNRANQLELAWKRTHVYFAPTHSEEDDMRKKFPEDHCWGITVERSISGSSSLQNYH